MGWQVTENRPSAGSSSRLRSDRDEMYWETRTAGRRFGMRRDGARPQGTKFGDEKKMSEMESKSGDPRYEMLRELHNALDSTEAHLKRIPASERARPHLVDLLLQLRRLQREIDMRVSAGQRQRPPL